MVLDLFINTNKMTIETKYEYVYYTVLEQDWFDEAERILTDALTCERLINAIERKLQHPCRWTLNKFKVDYSEHCDDIQFWIHRNNQHGVRPVFIPIEHNQPVVKSGSGTLFVFYEEDDDEDADDDYDNSDSPDGYYYGSVDGLTGAGGRL